MFTKKPPTHFFNPVQPPPIIPTPSIINNYYNVHPPSPYYYQFLQCPTRPIIPTPPIIRDSRVHNYRNIPLPTTGLAPFDMLFRDDSHHFPDSQ